MEKIKNTAIIILCLISAWLLIDRYLVLTEILPSEKTNGIAHDSTLSISGPIKIAYVNVDSILLGYEQAIEMNATFSKKQQDSEAEFAKKARVFEKDYMAFQEKAQRAGFLSQSSMETQQRDLLQQQEALQKLEEKLTQDLMAEQQRLNEILYNTIVDYVHEYNADSKYDLILTNTGLGTIMYGNPLLDITRQILEGLNTAYSKK